METRKSEVQVGIITIFSLVVLIAGMMWFKDMSVSRGLHVYQVDFPKVEGMQVGDRVQVRGIRVGQVDGYEIMAEFVRVRMKIDQGVRLGADAVVTLGTKGIVGEVVIGIDPGVGAAVDEGHIFQGRTAASIETMTDAASEALTELRTFSQRLSALIEEIAETGKVVQTLATANRAVKNFDVMVDENRRDLRETLGNLNEASAGLRELMTSGQIDSAFADVAGTAARADSMMTVVGQSARRLESILAKLDEGGGTAALLLNDPALYQNADSTLTSLHRLLDEMRRNPKKYFKLNVF